MKKKRSKFYQRLLSKELYRHPYAVPVITIAVLAVVSLFAVVFFGGTTIGPGDSRVVQLSIEGEKQTVPTRADTVQEFLERADITLNEGDVVEPSKDELIAGDNFRINVYRARPVTIFDGNKRVQALSAAKAPRMVADQAGVKVYPEDTLKQEVSDDILRDQVIGEKITIDRATPVNLNLYGTPTTVRTQVDTVGQLLQEKGIVLTKGDKVVPSVSTSLRAGMTVAVARSGIVVKTVEESIEPPIEYVEDASLSFGATAVRQAGTPGKKSVTYEITMKNGKEVSRKKIQEATITQPVKQIVARGKAFDINTDKAAVMAAAGISESDYPYVDYIISRESGWRVNATNGSTWGLCQALPGSKMASAGADWQTNPVTQLKWCSGYAAGKGGWAAAYEFWVRNHWW
ncbi:DUF348 domain-containing protein [Candidatus Saccharibacteria bacterium]|nr:DUF348 domain-containing protein [Candidatus Saccharibacteria bacterium]